MFLLIILASFGAILFLFVIYMNQKRTRPRALSAKEQIKTSQPYNEVGRPQTEFSASRGSISIWPLVMGVLVILFMTGLSESARWRFRMLADKGTQSSAVVLRTWETRSRHGIICNVEYRF